MGNLDHILEESDINFPSWALSNGIKEILDKMTGIIVTEESVNLEVLREFKEQVSGMVVLVGEKKLIFSVCMSTVTARHIVGGMTNTPNEEVKNADLIDGVSELANIVGGNVRAKLAARGEDYTMLLPFTIIGDNYHVVHKSKTPIFIRKYNAEFVELIVKGYSLDVG